MLLHGSLTFSGWVLALVWGIFVCLSFLAAFRCLPAFQMKCTLQAIAIIPEEYLKIWQKKKDPLCKDEERVFCYYYQRKATHCSIIFRIFFSRKLVINICQFLVISFSKSWQLWLILNNIFCSIFRFFPAY